jgi:hypothetical protein
MLGQTEIEHIRVTTGHGVLKIESEFFYLLTLRVHIVLGESP